MKVHLFKKPTTRDPFSTKPLRDPGESLQETLDDLLWDRVAFWLFMSAFATVFAITDWCRWYFNTPPTPAITTTTAAVVAGIALYKINQVWPELQNLKRGRNGERYVGQLLQNELPALGYRVFHDIRDERGNIDHVLIGPGGVFSVETKTCGKPTGKCEVRFDGTHIHVNGHTPDRDPIQQARVCASRVSEILRDHCGMSVNVRPVVVYPGWFVEPPKHKTDVWVLHEKPLLKFVANERPQLTSEQIEVLANALARHVRKDMR